MENRYEIEGLVHQGSMSRVFRATDRETGERVILKQAASDDPVALAALVQERENLIRLSHPGVVTCRDMFFRERTCCLVLEEVPGPTLAALADASPSQLPESSLVSWGIQIARILEYLHSRTPPVIHRDLKPDHFILKPDGTVVLIDFGIARVKKGAIRDTVALGTPGFCPPEQYPTAARETDESADIYALGVTLFHLATRQDPTPYRFDFPPVARLCTQYSAAFSDVVSRCVAPDSAQRFADVREVAAALERCREARSRMSPTGRASRAGNRESWPAIGSPAMLAVKLLALAAFVGWAWDAAAEEEIAVSGLVFWCVLAVAGRVLLGWCRARAECSERQTPDLCHLLWIVPLAMLLAWLAGGGDAVGFLRRLPQGVFPVSLAFPLGVSPGLALVALGLALVFCNRCFSDALVRRAGRLRASLTDGAVALLLLSGCVFRVWWLDAVPVRVAGCDTSLLWQRTVEPGAERLAFGAERHKSGDLFAEGARWWEALDPLTGAERWKLDVRGRRRVGSTDRGPLFAGSGEMVEYSEETGRPERSWPLPGFIRSVFFDDRSSSLYADLDDRELVRLGGSGRILSHLSTGPCNLLGFAQQGGLLIWRPDGKTLSLLAADLGGVLWTRRLEDDARPVYNPWDDSLLSTSAAGVDCFEAASGRERFHSPWPWHGGLTRDDAEVRDIQDHFVLTASGRLACLAPRGGQLLWRSAPMEERVFLRDAEGGFYLETARGKILKVRVTTGEVLWEHWDGGLDTHFLPRLGGLLGPVCAVRGAVFYCGSGGAALHALDSDSGRTLWTCRLPQTDRVRDMTWSNHCLFVLTGSPDGSRSQLSCYRVRLNERP